MDLLLSLDLPAGTKPFTPDATHMYTNILTHKALHKIVTFIHQQKYRFADISTNALSEALPLVIRNNVFQFEDIFWIRKAGAAMGTPHGCNYATIYYACREHKIIPNYKDNILI